MKYLITTLLLILFISILGKPNAEPDKTALVKVTEVASAKAIDKPEPPKPKQPEAVEPVKTPEPTPAPEPPKPVVATDCYSAVERYFPSSLWASAKIVVSKESGGRSGVVGATNYDGSNDYGCFQINNKAHANWFATHNWQDANQQAEYAYRLYSERGNWTAWYAVKGILW